MKFKIIIISAVLLLLGCSLINGPNKTTPISFDDFVRVGYADSFSHCFGVSDGISFVIVPITI